MNLGLEGGGTKTIVLTSTGRRRVFGPLNLKLVTDRQILAVLRQFKPTRAAICLAGCRTETDRQRLRRLACRAWGNVLVFVGNDLDSGLAAAFGNKPGILVISGTGSVVVGRNAAGQTARAGGWGHLLGDHGSGYWITLTGLRAAVRDYDRQGRSHKRLLRRLRMTSMEQLVDWIHQAGKDDIAALADLFQRDTGLQTQAASFLAMDAEAVARKLHFTPSRIVLAGGVLLHNARLRRLLTARLCRFFSGAKISVLRRDTAEGALLLASATTKLVLNMLTTIAMIRLGKVANNSRKRRPA
jgi:N-acetylglucosamine kinase-like BadF-type ATPase